MVRQTETEFREMERLQQKRVRRGEEPECSGGKASRGPEQELGVDCRHRKSAITVSQSIFEKKEVTFQLSLGDAGAGKPKKDKKKAHAASGKEQQDEERKFDLGLSSTLQAALHPQQPANNGEAFPGRKICKAKRVAHKEGGGGEERGGRLGNNEAEKKEEQRLPHPVPSLTPISVSSHSQEPAVKREQSPSARSASSHSQLDCPAPPSSSSTDSEKKEVSSSSFPPASAPAAAKEEAPTIFSRLYTRGVAQAKAKKEIHETYGHYRPQEEKSRRKSTAKAPKSMKDSTLQAVLGEKGTADAQKKKSIAPSSSTETANNRAAEAGEGTDNSVVRRKSLSGTQLSVGGASAAPSSSTAGYVVLDDGFTLRFMKDTVASKNRKVKKAIRPKEFKDFVFGKIHGALAAGDGSQAGMLMDIARNIHFRGPQYRERGPGEYSPYDLKFNFEVLDEGGKRRTKDAEDGERRVKGASGIPVDPENCTKEEVANLLAQLAILKQMTGLTDSELQWRVDSSRGNAFELANQRLEKAEEEYQRLLYEEGRSSKLSKDIQDPTLLPMLTALAKECDAYLQLKMSVLGIDDQILMIKRMISVETKSIKGALKKGMEFQKSAKLEGLEKQMEEQLAAKEKMAKQIEELPAKIEEQQEVLIKCKDKMNNFFSSLPDWDRDSELDKVLKTLTRLAEAKGDSFISLAAKEAKMLKTQIAGMHAQWGAVGFNIQKVLSDMEIWRGRVKSAPSYEREMVKLEMQWKEKNKEKNEAALQQMRSLLPLDLSSLSIEDIQARPREKGILFPREFAFYIKENKLLHWIVTHTDDITTANFLAGEHAKHFQNFEQLDIVELRAIYCMIPIKFSLDKEGKKAEWRVRFFEHLKALSRQDCEEEVDGPWDPKEKKRTKVKCLPLDGTRRRKAIYRYLTQEEIQARLTKFETQEKRQDGRRKRLQLLKDKLIPEAKAEYDAAAADARDAVIRERLGKDTVIQCRNTAKQQYDELLKERQQVEAAVREGDTAAAAAPISFQQFKTEITLYENLRGQPIPPAFSPDACPQPMKRSGLARKLSVEEEARERQEEMNRALAAKRVSVTEEGSGPQASPNTPPPPETSTSAPASGEEKKEPLLPAPALEQKAEEGGNGEAVPSPSAPAEAPVADRPRRRSSIQAAPEVLKFLTEGLCNSPRGVPRTPAPTPKASVSSTPAVASADEKPKDGEAKKAPSEMAPPVPLENLKPKSKAVQMMIERTLAKERAANEEKTKDNDDQRPVHPLLGRKPMGFLAELKKRAGGGEDRENSPAQPPSESPAPKLPFGLPVGGPGGPKLSFLSELKKRANQGE